MRGKIFVDSNIWLYMFLKDDKKKFEIIEEYFEQNNSIAIFIISYQVINEVSNVLLKRKFTETEVRGVINYLLKICTLQEFSKEILITASFVREKYTFSFWDSILVGSSLFAGCHTLISEDMHNGLLVNDKLLIKNIFK